MNGYQQEKETKQPGLKLNNQKELLAVYFETQ